MKKKFIIVIAVIFLVLTTSFFIYVGNYYHTTNEEIIKYVEKESSVKKDNIYFNADNAKDTGFIIYPGAKVEETAYAGLAKELVTKGYTTVIASFPFHFAFFDSNVADEIIESQPQVKEWVIIGHSLGGAIASNYVEKTDKNITGVVYLASYPAAEIKTKSIYIYGENDLVLSVDKVPSKDSENVYVIEGGNHSGFGYYGPQKGDGESTISKEEQIDQTVKIILNNFR